MNRLNDEDIETIYNDVRAKGITMQVLLDEMVDHICCSIEKELFRGIDFNTAYTNLMNNIESSTFKTVQHQTSLATNLKFIIMKKIMFISGLLGTILIVIGAFFKINHIAGAGVGMFLGIFTIVFIFLPLFFYSSYKEQVEKPNLLLYIIGYLTLAFLLLGPLFRVMHWPLTDVFFFYGPLLLAGLFLPVYLVTIFKKANETRTNLLFIIILIGIGFSTLFMFSATNLSFEVLNNYNSAYQQNIKLSNKFSSKNDSLIMICINHPKLEKSKENFRKIKLNANELKEKIDKIMLEMIQEANSKDATLENFAIKDNKKVCGIVMQRNDNAVKLNESIDAYQKLLLSLISDEYQKQVIKNNLSFDFFKDNIRFQRFGNYVLAEALVFLSNMQKNIEISEFLILNTLLSEIK